MLVRLQLDEEDADTARKWLLAIIALRNEHAVSGELVVLTAHRTCARTVGTMGGQDVDPLSAERGCGTDCHSPRHGPPQPVARWGATGARVGGASGSGMGGSVTVARWAVAGPSAASEGAGATRGRPGDSVALLGPSRPTLTL